MNDFSSSFHPAEARPRRRFVPPQDGRPPARARPVVRSGASALQAAAAQAQACARGEIACRAAWLHVQALGPAGVLALRPNDRPGPLPATGTPSLAHIAAEAEHMLAHGVRAGSARALVLLAALAAARFDDADAAGAIAAVAVTLAQGAEAIGVQRLHAALMLARATPFATCLHAFDGLRGADDVPAALLATGMRFAAGVPLLENMHSLEQALGTAPPDCVVQEEGAARLALLRKLVVPQARTPAALAGTPVSFNAWNLRLQLAWFGGDRLAACSAALAAGPLAGALTAPADLLTYHMFAVLALAWDASPQYRHALRWHRSELALASARCTANAGAMAALAGAVELASAGDVPGALSGYEAAAAVADSHGQAWIAALAWELAAALCQQYAFGAAMPAYRRRALMAWHACGAHGRIARLCRGWNGDDTGQAPAGATAGWCCDGAVDQNDQQGEQEQRRVARASTVGDLGVSIAHEVNQPLAAILLQAAAARRWLRRPKPDLDKALDALEQIAVSGRRAGDIVRSVQGLARRESADLAWFPVDTALDEALRLLGRTLRKHGVRAELALDLAGCQIRANRAQVQQVVINLLLNAVDALAGVEDRARQVVLGSRRLGPSSIEISVADNGPGVAPQDRDHIFDALFSTKAQGTGVGLSICRAIAEAHGGHITYRPRTPHGALFALVLALDAAPAE